MHRYLDLLRHPAVGPHLWAALLGALPLGMAPLTVLLAVQGWTGSAAQAGLAAGLFSLGNAAGLLVLARFLDTARAGVVTLVSGSACGTSLLALTLAGPSVAPQWVLLTLSGAAGLSVPPVTTAVRAWLPSAVVSPADRAAAYALLSLAFQAALVLGPMLVAGCALLAGPTAAAAATAGVALLAGVGHAFVDRHDARPDRGGALVARRTTDVVDRGREPAARPSMSLAVILPVAVLSGTGSGVLLIALPATADAAGMPVTAGLLLAVLAAGEAVGALGLGAVWWRADCSRQLSVALGALTVSFLGASAAVVSLPALTVAVLLLGALGGPVSVLLSTLLDDVVDNGSIARGYSALVCAGLLGAAAGSAGAGHLLATLEPGGLLVAAAAATGAACLVAATGRHPS